MCWVILSKGCRPVGSSHPACFCHDVFGAVLGRPECLLCVVNDLGVKLGHQRCIKVRSEFQHRGHGLHSAQPSTEQEMSAAMYGKLHCVEGEVICRLCDIKS